MGDSWRRGCKEITVTKRLSFSTRPCSRTELPCAFAHHVSKNNSVHEEDTLHARIGALLLTGGCLALNAAALETECSLSCQE
eukprot:2834482-Rhodomonas_salina.2